MENRRRAEENFGISRMVRAYEDLWESLVRRVEQSGSKKAALSHLRQVGIFGAAWSLVRYA